MQLENDNVLVVSGERKRDKDNKDVKRRVGKFMRKFVLPDNANMDNITVEKKLPPPEPKRPKTIEVKLA